MRGHYRESRVSADSHAEIYSVLLSDAKELIELHWEHGSTLSKNYPKGTKDVKSEGSGSILAPI